WSIWWTLGFSRGANQRRIRFDQHGKWRKSFRQLLAGDPQRNSPETCSDSVLLPLEQRGCLHSERLESSAEPDPECRTTLFVAVTAYREKQSARRVFAGPRTEFSDHPDHAAGQQSGGVLDPGAAVRLCRTRRTLEVPGPN